MRANVILEKSTPIRIEILHRCDHGIRITLYTFTATISSHQWTSGPKMMPSKCPYCIIATIFPSICHSSIMINMYTMSVYSYVLMCLNTGKGNGNYKILLGKKRLSNSIRALSKDLHTSVMSTCSFAMLVFHSHR